MQPDNKSPPVITFKEAIWYWLKLGFISFGGPAGQIAIMHHDLVEKKRWISEKRFLHALNYCMLLPGPEAQQLATYIGWLMHRTWGGIIAGGLFILPSLFILIALSWVYLAYGNLPQIAGVLYGIKPAVVAIVMFAAYRIGSRVLKNAALWSISAAAFIAVAVFDVPFPYIILMAALTAYIGNQVTPGKFSIQAPLPISRHSQQAFVIDDRTPAPDHAVFNAHHFIRLVIIALGLWGLALGLLTLFFGWQATLTQMGWFFTKAALLTFGGAYAVLPYVFEGAVETHGWLTAAQMMDGLALGETTPGPLIMLVAFVGFVGGWSHAILGVENLFVAGVVAACVCTFFTFLPSFLFIFIGGPLVESTQDNLKLTAPLVGITAAVVGAILNLAAFFAYHVIWPQGSGSSAHWFAVAACITAFVALFHFKVSVIQLIVFFGLAGYLHHILL